MNTPVRVVSPRRIGTVWVPEHLVTSPDMYVSSVGGDCMEPDLLNGDLILVDPRMEPRDGDIAVVWVTIDGIRRLMLKRFRDGGVLEPANPKYEPIRTGPEHELVTAGVVVASLSPVQERRNGT